MEEGNERLDCREKLMAITKRLVGIRSEVNTDGERENERRLLDALDDANEAVKPDYGHPIVAKNFFTHISDMSFVAMSDEMSEIDDMVANTPSWGKKLYVDYQDVADLNIPVVNIGPYGEDGHKRLERMEMTYSLEVVPNLTNRVLRGVLESE